MAIFGYLLVVLTGIIVIAVSKTLEILWTRMITIRWVYLGIRAPGIVVHECSHILGCFLTGAKVKNVVLLSKEGGSVTYSPSPVLCLGDVIINTAPLFCIPFVLYGFTWIFSTYLGCTIPVLSPVTGSADALYLTITQIGGMFTTNLLYRFNPWFLAYLYLTVSLVLSLSPSRQDMKNAIAGIALIFVTGLLIFWINFGPAVMALDTVTGVVGVSFGIALGFGMIALVISLPLFVIYVHRH